MTFIRTHTRWFLLPLLYMVIQFFFPLKVLYAAHSLHQCEERMTAYACDGDMKGYFSEWEKMLQHWYASPRAWVYLQQAGELVGVAGNERILSLIKSTRNKVYSDKALACRNQMLLHLDLEREAVYRDLRASHSQHQSRINPVTRWVINGPYNRYGYGDLWYAFVPEISGSMVSLAEEGRRIHAGPVRGKVLMNEIFADDGGIIYATSSFPVTGTVKIRVYSNMEYILRINGKRIFENTKESVMRKCRIARVNVAKGVTIMLKMRNSPNSYFRILATDDRDMMIPVQYTDDMFHGLGEYMELMDYPYMLLSRDIQEKKELGLRRMGMYFDNLGSSESLKYYRKAIKKNNKDYYTRAKFLDVMEYNNSRSDNEAEMKIASDIIEASEEGKHECVLLNYQYARLLAASGKTRKAITEGIKIASEAPAYLPLYKLLIQWCGIAGREDLSARFIAQVKREFPHYSKSKLMEAEYYKTRNLVKCENICRDILAREYNDRAKNILMEVLSSQQRYSEMVKVADTYGKKWLYMEKLFHGYVALKQYDKCRTFLMNEMVQRNNMMGLYYLGKMEILLGEDPALYWDKLILEKPGWYWFRNRYYSYKAISGKGNIDDVPVSEIFTKTLHVKSISRKRQFKISGDGYCELNCRDVIYTGNIENFKGRIGIRIPVKGNTRIRDLKVTREGVPYSVPVQVVYDEKGTIIQFSGLKGKSILSCSIDIQNVLDDGLRDRFVTLKRMKLSDFSFPVDKIEVRIVYPADMHMSFASRGMENIREYRKGEENIYEAVSGNSSIAEISFTNHESWQDFSVMYNGIVKKSGEAFHLAGSPFPEDARISDLINRVYERIQKKDTINGGSILHLRRSVDVLYSGKGTVAEKAILAKYILASYGVKTYLAFPMGEEAFYDESANYARISRVMLYVPLGDNDSVWLDFSIYGLGAGFVHSDVDGADALVLVGDTVEWMSVREN